MLTRVNATIGQKTALVISVLFALFFGYSKLVIRRDNRQRSSKSLTKWAHLTLWERETLKESAVCLNEATEWSSKWTLLLVCLTSYWCCASYITCIFPLASKPWGRHLIFNCNVKPIVYELTDQRGRYLFFWYFLFPPFPLASFFFPSAKVLPTVFICSMASVTWSEMADYARHHWRWLNFSDPCGVVCNYQSSPATRNVMFHVGDDVSAWWWPFPCRRNVEIYATVTRRVVNGNVFLSYLTGCH